MIDPITMTAVYELFKFWVPIAGFFFGVYKAWDWVKKSVTGLVDDVKEIKTSLAALIITFATSTKDQTIAFTSELKEQRQDFRAFFLPLFSAAQTQNLPSARPARAKRSTQTVTKKSKKSNKKGLTKK